MLLRNARSTHISQTPLTKATGRVACILEDVSNRDVILAQGGTTGIASYRGVASMLAGHEHTTRGSTDIGTSEELGEAHALGSKLVDVGSFQDRVSHRRPFKIAPLIHHDVDDIRRPLRRSSHRRVNGEE